MAIRFLDADAAGQFRDRMNGDPEFKLVARDMALNLAFEVGSERRLVKLRDGEVRTIGPFSPLTEPIDVTIRGSGEFWQKLLSPVPPPRFQNLYAGVRAGTCEVMGNSELYFAYLAAIMRMIEVMREFENR